MLRPHAFAALLTVSALAQAGNVYRWVDAQGQVHYGETPPIGARSESPDTLRPGVVMDATPAPAAAPAPASAPAAPAAAPAESAKDKAKRCADAQARITFLQDTPAVRIMVQQQDGTPARMTDEQHDAQLAQAQKIASGACGH